MYRSCLLTLSLMLINQHRYRDRYRDRLQLPKDRLQLPAWRERLHDREVLRLSSKQPLRSRGLLSPRRPCKALPLLPGTCWFVGCIFRFVVFWFLVLFLIVVFRVVFLLLGFGYTHTHTTHTNTNTNTNTHTHTHTHTYTHIHIHTHTHTHTHPHTIYSPGQGSNPWVLPPEYWGVYDVITTDPYPCEPCVRL